VNVLKPFRRTLVKNRGHGFQRRDGAAELRGAIWKLAAMPVVLRISHNKIIEAIKRDTAILQCVGFEDVELISIPDLVP
jgi:hypothetical protein